MKGYTKVDSEKLRAAFKTAKRGQSETDKLLGFTRNFVSASLSAGRMQDEALERVCMLLGIAVEDVKAEDPKPENPAGGVEVKSENPEVISYIQDLGKIQTDILRNIHDLQTAITQAVDLLDRDLATIAQVMSGAKEDAKNFHVATASNFTKIHNQMKFGGKI